MKLTYAVVMLGFSICAPVFAASSDQAAINTLQKQIASVQSEMHAAMTTQQAATQKAIEGLQAQTQKQITHLQNQMQKMQNQLTQEIKQVQAEMQQLNAAPAVKSAPVKK